MKAFVNDLDMDEITVVDYNGEEQKYSVNDIVKVDELNYQQEFINQPAKYAYWSSVLQAAKRVAAEQEAALDKQHAVAYNKVYEVLNSKNMRPTKDLIESYIEQDEDYQNAKQRVIVADYSAGRIQYLVKALEQRENMLVQLGADIRKEKNYGN